jgi:hypothetical protein
MRCTRTISLRSKRTLITKALQPTLSRISWCRTPTMATFPNGFLPYSIPRTNQLKKEVLKSTDPTQLLSSVSRNPGRTADSELFCSKIFRRKDLPRRRGPSRMTSYKNL